MKKLSLVLIIILQTSYVSYSQTSYLLNNDTSKFKDSPLFVLIGYDESPTPQIPTINPNSIDSIKVLKSENAIKEFGERGKNGIIKIKLKRGITLVDKTTLLKQYHIKETNLPMYIDSTISQPSKNIYFQSSIIKSISIQQEKETGMNYISVLTTQPIKRPKPGEIFIR